MAAGLFDTGFVAKTVESILADITAQQRALIAGDLDEGAEEILGQLNGTVAAKIREVWELAAAVHASFDPRSAFGQSLVARCALTGTTPRAATYGSVTLTLTVAAHTTVAAGAQAYVVGQPDNLWTTTEDAVNDTSSPASVSVDATCAVAGRVPAGSGTITVKATPVAGWTAVTNAADAIPGLDAETVPELRARREAELQASGSSATDALRAAVAAVSGVVRVLVVPNDTDLAVGLRPPHSVEVIVQGGTNAAVAAAIWRAKAAGIATAGSSSDTILDDAGASRQVFFTRPSTRNVYLRVAVKRAATYAGDTAVSTAVLAVGAALLMGQTVQMADIIVAAMGVAGVLNARVTLGWSSVSLLASDLVPGATEIPVFDASRITVATL